MTKLFKAVFFDLDGTLRIPTPSPTDAFVYFARSLNITIPPAKVKHVKRWAHHYWGQDEVVLQDLKRFDEDGFWINYSRMLLQAVDEGQALHERAVMVREWFGNEYAPEVALAPGSLDLLERLKTSGYWLGLVSNRSTPLDTAVTKLGLDGLFDFTVAAGEIGYWKPNPQIFAHTLLNFEGLRAGECLFVGDNLYADCLGARDAGMHPILFDPDNLYESSEICRIQRMSELEKYVPVRNR